MIDKHMDRLPSASIGRIVSMLVEGTQAHAANDVLVLLGFPSDVYSSDQLAHCRLFPRFAPNEALTSLIAGRKALVEALSNVAVKQWPVWCTYEEFVAASPDVFYLFKSPIFLTTGIYYTAFPLSYELGGWNNYFAKLCSEPEEVDAIDTPPPDVREAFDRVYSAVLETGGKWYVSYANMPDTVQELFSSSSTLVQSDREIAKTFSLGAEERDLLSVFQSIDQLDCTELAIYIEKRLTPTRFIERIGRFQVLVGKQCNIEVRERPPTSRPGKQYPEIKQILQKQWHHKEFRSIRVYRNLSSFPLDKSTDEVQQSEIIETILEQTENAIAGRAFRDVFVTAPTGSGKSLIFQIPALLLAQKYDLMTLVISPLIGLMNDQVENLYLRNIESAATINSGVAPALRDEIQLKIENKEISILYISPETLLSRSDISALIGSRRVGLFIIDEAHIVTTWGKAFRSDYWYLGTYLQKLRREHPCVVATFTATAIYGGIEDMFVETRDSLNMVNPKTYLGYIPRENIEINIQNKNDYKGKGHEYLRDKFAILLNRMRQLQSQQMKTLVYFPIVKMIQQFIDFANANGAAELIRQVGRYYGPLDKNEKEDAYRDFRSGKTRIMLATKAFGMGIDIPDIAAVYHFAPTGNVCDYIQEIGRAARQIPAGHAILDYLPGDFSHVNRLHGISTITKQQLIGTLKKILEISKNDNNRRRLLIRSEDFRYLFASSVNTEDDEVDNKLKTALLILEKDFINRYGYAAILARPRQLFTVEYYSSQSPIDSAFPTEVGRNFKLDEALSKTISVKLYRVDLKAIWLANFPNISFAQFKYYFRNEPDKLALPGLRLLSPTLMLRLKIHEGVRETTQRLFTLLDAANASFAKFTNPNRKFSSEEFGNALKDAYAIESNKRRAMATSILQSAYVFCSLMKRTHIHYQWFLTWDRESDKYQLKSPSYQDYSSWMNLQLSRLVHLGKVESGVISLAIGRSDRVEVLSWYTFLGSIEQYGLGTFISQGGENPEIFVRINSPLVLQQVVERPDQYRNIILENVHMRHQLSVAMLSHLFTEKSETAEFWNAVEDYFLGKIPQKILDGISRPKI